MHYRIDKRGINRSETLRGSSGMMIPDETITEIRFPGSAYAQAQIHYLTFPRVKFEDDLLDYLKHGFVVSRPNLFAMAKVIIHPRQPKQAAWFVRYACGDIQQIVRVLPFFLEWIVWCRNDEPRLRIYRTSRLLVHGSSPRGSKETPNGTNVSLAGSNPVAASRKVMVQ